MGHGFLIRDYTKQKEGPLFPPLGDPCKANVDSSSYTDPTRASPDLLNSPITHKVNKRVGAVERLLPCDAIIELLGTAAI